MSPPTAPFPLLGALLLASLLFPASVTAPGDDRTSRVRRTVSLVDPPAQCNRLYCGKQSVNGDCVQDIECLISKANVDLSALRRLELEWFRKHRSSRLGLNPDQRR